MGEGSGLYLASFLPLLVNKWPLDPKEKGRDDEEAKSAMTEGREHCVKNQTRPGGREGEGRKKGKERE